MEWFALGLFGVIGATIVVACLIVLLVRHRLQLAHRVDPKVATAAPASWLADPRTPARLHRRLAKVGRTASAVAGDHRVATKRRRPVDQPPIVELADRLKAQAVGLDHELARVALLPTPARRGHLSALESSVRALEQAALRLVSLSTELLTPPVLATEDADLFDVAAQIERLEHAHRELLDIDRSQGLTQPGV